MSIAIEHCGIHDNGFDESFVLYTENIMNAFVEFHPVKTFTPRDIDIDESVSLNDWEQQTNVIFGQHNLRVAHHTKARTEYESICGEADTSYSVTETTINSVELEILTPKGVGYIDITRLINNSLYDVIGRELKEQAA